MIAHCLYGKSQGKFNFMQSVIIKEMIATANCLQELYDLSRTVHW